jgi:DNA ligase-4
MRAKTSLLSAQKDRERAVYHVKEKNLAKLFIRAIPLGKNDPDAIHLLNWKKPAEESVGGFSSIA